MNFDVFTIAAVVDELRTTLVGGRVQDSLEIGNDALGLEIYANHSRHYLMISADPQEARIHLVPDRVRRGVDNPSPLGLMLRRNIEGAWLHAVTQPAWERIVHLEFENGDGRFTLIVEPMERRSNILLVRDGQIMDCLRRVGPQDNRVRLSLPGHEYVPPPPQANKRPPTDLTLDLLKKALDADPGKVAWRALTDTLLGFSPMLAKESVYRAMGKATLRAGDTSARSLYEAIDDLLPPLLDRQWQPGITAPDGKDGPVSSYSVYPVTQLPGWLPIESISEALSTYYGAPVGTEAYTAAKEPIKEMIGEARAKIEKRLAALKRSQTDDSERERLKQSGELLLAYQYQIKPGQATFSAQYDFDAPPVEIKLDTSLGPVDNAKHYFDLYERAKRATAEVPGLIAATENEIAFLDQLQTDLDLAPNWPEIGEVQDALQANGYWRGPKSARPRGSKSGPLRAMMAGLVIWVGRNSRQNDDVTFSKGCPDDLWLHAHGVPGAHVIIKSGGRPVASSILQKAASLAAYYSASRSEGHVLVDVTERRYVRKIKGGKPGMVTYRHETPITVTPAAEV